MTEIFLIQPLLQTVLTKSATMVSFHAVPPSNINAAFGISSSVVPALSVYMEKISDTRRLAYSLLSFKFRSKYDIGTYSADSKVHFNASALETGDM